MKRILKGLLFLLVCMIALSVHTEAYAKKPAPVPSMYSTCVADELTSLDQVKIDNDIADKAGPLEDGNAYAIKKMLNAYNKNVFMATVGHYFPVDPSIVLGQPLLDELNARNKYMVKYYGNAKYFDGYRLNIHYKQLAIQGNVAKVLLVRDIEFRDKDLNETIDAGGLEGYILKKDNGRWKIANVIFCTRFLNDYIKALEKDNDGKNWLNRYGFDKVQRKNYEDLENFAELLDENGEIIEPVLETRKFDATINEYGVPQVPPAKEKKNLEVFQKATLAPILFFTLF